MSAITFLKKSFVSRALNRLFIICKDFYIDLYIQRRLISDRPVNSVAPESGINRWQNTSYDSFNAIFFKHKYVTVKPGDIIIDVGCADGKLFNCLLYKGLKNRVLGYEINKAAGLKTKNNLLKYSNVEIILEDIFDSFPADATLFYLFNPFDEKMMLRFIENIKKISCNKPTIVYNYPLFAHLFDPQKKLLI